MFATCDRVWIYIELDLIDAEMHADADVRVRARFMSSGLGTYFPKNLLEKKSRPHQLVIDKSIFCILTFNNGEA